MQLKIGYLFQCPPWARSFCPLPFPSDGDRWFRAYWVISTVQVVLFLGFEHFNADYFSDLSILTRFISRI